MKYSIESLKFENLNINFEGDNILENCTFEFPLNKRCRVVFNNDKEKFIFFHAMTQVEGIESGQYLMNGEDLCEFTFEEFLPYRLNIGYGFSTRGLIHNRTLQQNLELPLIFHKLKTPDEAREWVYHLAQYFEISPEDLNKRPADVSPSVQKSALILRAFVHCPELVILDAPEVLLSGKLHANLLQLIDDQMKNHGLKHLLFATSNEDLSDCLADKNIILRKRKLELVTAKKLKRVAS
ncbi:MAG: hypothetical protein HRT44_07440 [Bdellovibrionales bacterium]|nr:hypothetical protein [Bdellovibrionales bacterium]NQZ19071.1 hypothetical protein [Bdellovibrionales bacterium]